ncbi:MAG: hypothetical protein R6W68_01640, partial [Ignavibacteriaceae bacterium]
LFSVYGYVHSILASIKFKEFLRKQFGKLIAFYRLLFNVFSVIGLYLIWEFGPHPSLLIYELNSPVRYHYIWIAAPFSYRCVLVF